MQYKDNWRVAKLTCQHAECKQNGDCGKGSQRNYYH